MRIGLIIMLFLLKFSCSDQEIEKINGVSFVASRDRATQEHIEPVLRLHADYAAVMPFGFVRELNSPEIIFDTERQWFGETQEGAAQYIEILHRNQVKVMMKPQIWIRRGEFTGDMEMDSETDWQLLEASYRDFILTYARLAQNTGTEILCIGTELEEFVMNRPQYWDQLIDEIKGVYKGKLTYAANWDEYFRVPFWGKLDYIGVDAYFPLSEKRSPEVNDLREGWQKWKEGLQELSELKGKPILFTEYGYRSMDYTAKKPWLVDRYEEKVNLVAQANAKQALFMEFWQEPWFAGGFLWKWFIHHERSGGTDDNRFTPQNKPAEQVVQKYYSQKSQP